MNAVSLDRPVTEFLSSAAFLLREGWGVDEALGHLRAGRCEMCGPRVVKGVAAADGNGDGEGLGRMKMQVVYFYVVNEQGQLVGVLPARQLLLSAAAARIGEIMTRDIIVMSQKETLLDAMELFAIHRLLAMPVVDEEKRMLGIIELSLYTDEVFDLAKRRKLNEVFQLIGLRVEEARAGSAWKGFRMRMPWLLSNITGGLICAALGAFFEATVQKVVLIALFIPLILTLAESIAVQTMTLSIERAASGGKMAGRWLQEAATAILLGICSGGIVGLVSLFWPGPRGASVMIGSAVACVMLVAAMLGRIVPGMIHGMKLNPRVASGPITLAVVDVVTVTVYLSMATVVF